MKIPLPLDENYKVINTEIITMLRELIYEHKLTKLEAIMQSKLPLAIKYTNRIEQASVTELESIFIDIYFLRYETYEDHFKLAYLYKK